MNSSDPNTPKPDWAAIKAYYESSDAPLCEVAEQFGVSLSTLKKRSAREEWNRDGTKPTKLAPSDGTMEPENGTTTDLNGTKEPKNGTASDPNGTTEPENGSKSGSGGSRNGTKISQNGTTPIIPSDFGSFDRLAAAQFYTTTLGWAIHPLLPPDRGEPQERGKKPILKGWRNHHAAEITPDFLTKYFGGGSTHNIGCVVRPPFIHVDLDSKPDAGASVMAWLSSQQDLAHVPRERTGGGAHLAFICRDIPGEVMKSKKAPTCQINDKVSAELYLDGLNIVLSPSVHKSGHAYTWEVTGEIPEVSWKQLCRWFGFSMPEVRQPGRPKKEKPWWSAWEQDLRTLDLAGVMEEFNRLGECLDPDHHKWSVRCPWEANHTGGVAEAPGSDTIIFNQPETMPGFKCLHSHCESRGIKEQGTRCSYRKA